MSEQAFINDDPIMSLEALEKANPEAAKERQAKQQEEVATDVKDITPSPFPDESARPAYVVLDDWTDEGKHKLRPGTYFCGISEGTKHELPTPYNQWVCSPLHVDALTRDGQADNFGRLLRFRNSLGGWRKWAMPMMLLKGSGEDLRGELLAMGLELDPRGAKTHLASYLQWRTPKRKMLAATQTGWAGKSFVLPDEVIGAEAAGVVFQSSEHGQDEYTKAGTLQGWQAGIAAKASGNPLLLLALSSAFTGALLAKTNSEGGGVHFVGDSSTGKTTAIEAACSVWGGSNYRRSWRATANGMEGAAATFNDSLLALDEISECDPREIGAIVYALGNGRGKQRASRTGAARGVTRWRVFVLSSGERTMQTAMLEGGHRAKAGQAVRLLDVPAARQFGAWDNLHDAPTAAAFSDILKREAAANHGHAGRAFLERLTRDERDWCAYLEEFKKLPAFTTNGSDGQPKRAAARFALIGMAGELATEYGVTGWQEGESIEAAGQCFKLWMEARGTGNNEQRQIAQRLSDFLERHGDGRFSENGVTDVPGIRDRAGWWESTHDGRRYLMTTQAMREALTGFDFKRALDVLQVMGAIPAPATNGERAQFFRIGGRGLKLYPVSPDKLEVGRHES